MAIAVAYFTCPVVYHLRINMRSDPESTVGSTVSNIKVGRTDLITLRSNIFLGIPSLVLSQQMSFVVIVTFGSTSYDKYFEMSRETPPLDATRIVVKNISMNKKVRKKCF